MTTKKQQIRQIKMLLDTGKTIALQGRMTRGKLWADTRYIYWQHFGQSASKNTLANLTWIINVIFELKGKKLTYTTC